MLKLATDSSTQRTRAVVNDAPGMRIGMSDGFRKRTRGSSANAINGPTGVTIADGKWHHIAMTLAETETNGKHYTTVSVHKDYSATPDWTKTCPGRLHYSGDGSIWLGASKAGVLNGQVNELRISRGVLSPSEFMRIGASGLAILFR